MNEDMIDEDANDLSYEESQSDSLDQTPHFNRVNRQHQFLVAPQKKMLTILE